MKILISSLIVLILLLLSACGITTGNNVGVINGRQIPYNEFIEAYRSHYENFYTEKGRAPDLDEKKALERLTWQNITKYIILQSYFKKYKITVSQQEVIDTLLANPPQYITDSPWFKVDGVFNKTSYIQSLNYDNPYNLRPVRKHYLENVIPIMKLKDKLIDHELLTKNELRLHTEILKSSANIDLLVFDSKLQRIQLSDVELEQYYNNNQAEFLQSPFIKLNYTMITAEPSSRDLILTETIVDSISTDIQNGISIETIVNSSIGKSMGISLNDTGFLFIPNLDPSLKSIIRDMSPGQYTPPIRTESSFDIYRLEQITRSMVKFTKLQIPIKAREESIADAFRKAKNLQELSSILGFVQSCDEMDLTVCQTPEFSPGFVWLSDAETQAQFDKILSSSPLQQALEPIYSHHFGAWIVVSISDRQLNNAKPFEQVKDQIAEALSKGRRIEFTKQIAASWLEQTKPDYQIIGTPDQLSTQSYQNVSVNSSLDGYSSSYVLYSAFKSYITGNRTPSVFVENDMVIIPIIRTMISSNQLEIDREQAKSLFVRYLDNDWFDVWMNDQLAKARIKTISITEQ